jgi:thiol:disulfide interchange protein DsbD
MLAVVVAAPCTAPFMAGALGYAVSQPPAIALIVFTALGLGFAAPFTALAFAPALLRRMPRPGAWMSVFKTVLAFPMYGTAAWLAWVFAAQAGQIALGFLFGAALLIAFAAWLFGQGQRSFSPAWRIGLQLALPAAVIAAVALLYPVAKPQPKAEAAVAEAGPGVPHEAWAPERIAALQSEGKVVFVDFTADWCVTCKVNEGTALASRSVADAFADANAVYMVADWTLRDAKIAAALAEHGRTGVPLYLMYPAGGGAPKVMPQLLTEGMVKKALKEAAA